MEYGPTSTPTRERERDIEHTIGRAFLTAHLLTANATQAESAVVEAIESWHAHDETEQALLLRVVQAAVREPVGYAASLSSDKPDAAGSYLPVELQAVLRLSPQPRRCFVMRILAGLSRQVCARLLHLNTFKVDQCTRAAVKHLSCRRLAPAWHSGPFAVCLNQPAS